MSALTENVRRAAREAGADLVGFAPVSRFDNAPPLLHPRTIFPQTKTVIAVAVRHERGALKAVEEGTYWQAYNCDNYWYLNEVIAPKVLRAVVIFLEAQGHTSVPVHNPFHAHAGRKIRDDQPAGPDGMASLRVMGAAAGLGELGHSKLLLTPEFGPRQRVFAVFTDAELEPTPLLKEEEGICDGCRSCAKECEADAIGETRSVKIVIRDEGTGVAREFSHAPFDAGKCSRVHAGRDPRFSPFWNGTEKEGEEPSFNRFVKRRFRHCGICVGRGCLRACLDHLEKKGRLKYKFRTPMIERERWKLDEPPAGGGSA